MRNKHVLAAAAQLTEEWSGIVVPEFRYAVLESELRRFAPGETLEGALVRLSTADAPTRARFLSRISVGETYLFRHSEHFQILDRLAVERAQAGASLRVLSAGCSTGEEAWSAAVVLAHRFGASGSAIGVEGWDMDARRIERARRAEFSRWSARRGFAGYDRYFIDTPSGWRIAPELRRITRFHACNLVHDPYPTATEFDVIFLRNVTIYWRRERIARVFERLGELLTEDGLIILGPSDPAVQVRHLVEIIVDGQRIMRPRSAGDAPALRGAARASAPKRPTGPARSQQAPGRSGPGVAVGAADSLRVRRVLLGEREDGPRSRPAAMWDAAAARGPGTPDRVPDPADVPAAADVPGWASEVQRLANRSEFDAALDVLRGLAPPQPAEARMWEGTILLHLDRAREAVSLFRQAVYLEPCNPEFRRWLAIGFEAVGNAPAAAREYRNLNRLNA